MANELTSSFKAGLTNGNLIDSIPDKRYQVTQAVAEVDSGTVSVTTSESDLTVSGITTLGYLFLLNLGPTNYLTYGPKSGGSMVAFGRLKVGEYAWVRLEPGITLRWKANTATVTAFYKLFGN